METELFDVFLAWICLLQGATFRKPCVSYAFSRENPSDPEHAFGKAPRIVDSGFPDSDPATVLSYRPRPIESVFPERKPGQKHSIIF